MSRAVRRVVRQALKAFALRAVGFIVARPRLDGFMRRQLFRFPGLAGRVRAAIARSRRSDWQTLPALPIDEADLTDPARQVLRDLRRALERTRQP
jgi:hypothetical protein